MIRFNVDTYEIARRKAKLTNKQVCQMIGVTEGTMCTWKKGKNIPTSANLTKLSEVLSVNSSELVKQEDEGSVNDEIKAHAELDKFGSILLEHASSLMAFRSNLLLYSQTRMGEKWGRELLEDTDKLFNKIWGIVEELERSKN